MALQDLTPQLRTRLSRLERVVGWFVTLATLLLVLGLAYYVYQLAQRRGWFLQKTPYFTFVRNATGLKVGDPVRLMGFKAGEIVEITPQPPDDAYFNVFVRFWIQEPYFGYLWEDSQAKVGATDFLGNRFIEVSKGTNAAPTYLFHPFRKVRVEQAETLLATNIWAFSQRIYDPAITDYVARPFIPLSREALRRIAELVGTNSIQIADQSVVSKRPTGIWDKKLGLYKPFPGRDEKGYWLEVAESPALTERLESVVNMVEKALPDFLRLTNKLSQVLTKADNLTTHADDLLVGAKPVLANLALISSNLSGPRGSLGEWLIPTNINLQLQTTLGSANATLNTAQTNLQTLSSNILISLVNVANLTSNLHAQVEANGLILTEISELVVHTDEMVQGLKRHWLLKSTFGAPTNPPVQSLLKPTVGGGK